MTNQFDIISPYWGAKAALANSAKDLASYFLQRIPAQDKADILQLHIDYYCKDPAGIPLSNLIEEPVDRTAHWLTFALEQGLYDELPFNPSTDLVMPNATMSLHLKYSIAIQNWCSNTGYTRRSREQTTAPITGIPNQLLPFVISPYDPAMSIIFRKSAEYFSPKLARQSVEMLWHYLMVENGGFNAWRLIIKKLGISIQPQEWSEIRIQLERNLLSLLGRPILKNGSTINRKKGSS